MIYFIQNKAQRTVKIGTAENVHKRFQALQCANSEKLILLGWIPGDIRGEQKLHRRFRGQQVRGEWFHATKEILDAIDALIKSVNAPFMELCEIEPGLLELFKEAQAHEITSQFCANAVWYGYAGFEGKGIKARLTQMVGLYGDFIDERVRNKKAWDIAYHTIYQALPDCQKGCACMSLLEALIS